MNPYHSSNQNTEHVPQSYAILKWPLVKKDFSSRLKKKYYSPPLPSLFKDDVIPKDSQRRLLLQHSVAKLEQCCNYSKQCINFVVTLCCAKNPTSFPGFSPTRSYVGTRMQKTSLRIVPYNITLKWSPQRLYVNSWYPIICYYVG